MSGGDAIIIMGKQPRAGSTKTRMCPPFTPLMAAQLYEALLRDTLALVSGLANVQAAVAVSPPEGLGYFQQICPAGTLLIPVEGENIGVCLARALAGLFERGFTRALAMNSDGPSLPPAYLAQSFQMLEDHDFVLGAGEDGGYYLIGMKRLIPAVFEAIPWSTDAVLAKTLAQAQRAGLSAGVAPPWYDIDTPADAQRLRAEVNSLPAQRLVHTRRFFAQQEAGD